MQRSHKTDALLLSAGCSPPPWYSLSACQAAQAMMRGPLVPFLLLFASRLSVAAHFRDNLSLLSPWLPDLYSLISASFKRAIEELLRETDRARVRAETMGPAGWLKCPLRSTNKRFLLNTLRSTGLQRRSSEPRASHSATRSHTRSKSQDRSLDRSRSPPRDRKSNGGHTEHKKHHRDSRRNKDKTEDRDKDRSHRHRDKRDRKHRDDGQKKHRLRE